MSEQQPPPLPPPRKLRDDKAKTHKRGQGWAARGACLVCPGLGQFLERRFIAGLFFLVLCLLGMFMMAASFIGWYADYIQILMAEVEPEALAPLPWNTLIGGLILVFASYIWSFLDAGRQ